MTVTAPLHRETRSVSGVWLRDVWVDDAVLAHCRRAAQGGFPFRVRSAQVARALVAAGLATPDAHDPALLTGTPLALRHLVVTDAAPAAPTAAPTAAAATPRAAARPAVEEEFLGYCSSTHHAHRPVEAVVRGRRPISATSQVTEPVALCGRCADLMADAGFFRAA